MELSILHCTVQFPIAKNGPASNVSSAEVEKPCPRIDARSGLRVGWYCVYLLVIIVLEREILKRKQKVRLYPCYEGFC